MTEQEVIQKIKLLKQIKPNQEWAVLNKQQIIDNNSVIDIKAETPTIKQKFFNAISEFRFNAFKPALVPVFCAGLLFVFFSASQNALPGDLFFSAKKITEQTQINLTPEQERIKIVLELTNKRLEELAVVADKNSGKNLAPALLEVEKATKKSTESLKQTMPNNNNSELVIKEIEKIEESANEIEKISDIIVYADKDLEELKHAADPYFTEVYKPLAEQRIQDLQNSSFGYTTEQEQELKEIIELFEQGQYSQSYEKSLLFQ
ncbi:MAG: DUF5667 domain-containing protein [Patescibacteria group bacterium]|nr:DUF5667 domain-containing protein [Patescibacteria group bacterium]